MRPTFPAALLAAAACTTDTVRVIHTPTAFAGFDGSADVGRTVFLDGSQSADPDGLALSYAWKLEALPFGSKSAISPADQPIVSFVPDREGSYIASLTVSNGSLKGRDLVGILARTATHSSARALHIALDPPICNVDLAHPEMNSCGALIGGSGELAFATVPAASALPSDAKIVWTELRLPPGASAPSPPTPLRFAPKSPGEYWFEARVVSGDLTSPPAFASIGVFASPPALHDRPIAVIQGHDSAVPGERVLLDGTRSEIPSPPVPRAATYTWSLVLDPSQGGDMLVDAATGCPMDQCRVLVPTSKGTYLVALHVASGDIEGASALFALEVE